MQAWHGDYTHIQYKDLFILFCFICILRLTKVYYNSRCRFKSLMSKPETSVARRKKKLLHNRGNFESLKKKSCFLLTPDSEIINQWFLLRYICIIQWDALINWSKQNTHWYSYQLHYTPIGLGSLLIAACSNTFSILCSIFPQCSANGKIVAVELRQSF